MMRHLAGHVGFAAVMLVFAAGIHSRQAPRNFASPTNERHPAREAVSPDAPRVVPTSSDSYPVLRIWYAPSEEPPAPLLGALAEQDDPDPNVRLQALDAWARSPGESLDPVTQALVDPDESVRTRAQELLEQELARP